MGKIRNNAATRGFSGKLGDDIVFRQVDNKTVFSKRNEIVAPPTARQTQIRAKFTEAAVFASGAMGNPNALLEYQQMAELQKLKSAYVAAITDYLTMPEIAGVYVVYYKGRIGDQINITPKLAMKVVEIDVTILDANGAVIEAGSAVPQGLKWNYIATAANANLPGTVIQVTAKDRVGKVSSFEMIL
ncbi:MAG TPA: hypothetical protein VD884_23630 [Ohtaekwangia sp.]|nr:hypothetical protein [Ohtaekwangia sp.]